MGSILRCVVLYMRLAHVTRAGLWCLRISRCSARIAYCSIFALSLIISWLLCEVAAPLMEKLLVCLLKRFQCCLLLFLFWYFGGYGYLLFFIWSGKYVLFGVFLLFVILVKQLKYAKREREIKLERSERVLTVASAMDLIWSSRWFWGVNRRYGPDLVELMVLRCRFTMGLYHAIWEGGDFMGFCFGILERGWGSVF